jgi:enamine deaminase RidA (YjgF/YER057c/UK114 family)
MFLPPGLWPQAAATTAWRWRLPRVVKLFCLVNSGPSFTEQHLVANGASELLQEVFGKTGKHARSAVGVAQLPLGACVEIELVVEVR